jgi:hypothetical protein
MSKPTTEKDFLDIIQRSVTALDVGKKAIDLQGMHDCFELAKRISLSFTIWCFENKHYPIGMDIWTNYNTNPPRTIDGQELFELYQQQK